MKSIILIFFTIASFSLSATAQSFDDTIDELMKEMSHIDPKDAAKVLREATLSTNLKNPLDYMMAAEIMENRGISYAMAQEEIIKIHQIEFTSDDGFEMAKGGRTSSNDRLAIANDADTKIKLDRVKNNFSAQMQKLGLSKKTAESLVTNMTFVAKTEGLKEKYLKSLNKNSETAFVDELDIAKKHRTIKYSMYYFSQREIFGSHFKEEYSSLRRSKPILDNLELRKMVKSLHSKKGLVASGATMALVALLGATSANAANPATADANDQLDFIDVAP